MNRTVIIGSGITGLAAALLLAKQNNGAEILLLEASKQPAPLLSGFKRSGLHFDTGFHCAGGLRKGGLLRHWLQAIDMWDYIGDDNIYPLSEEFRFATSEQKYNFRPLYSELIPNIAEQFGQESANSFQKLMQEMASILDVSPYTNSNNLNLPKLSWENSQSITSKLEQYPLPLALKQMLKARCLLYGLTPEKATFHDYSLVGGLYFDSCHGIYGGGKTLVKAALKALKQHNITLRCNSQVSRILHKEKAFCGLELKNGETIHANTCIFTGHPAQLPNMVDKGVFRPAFIQHIEEMEETANALMLFGESSSPYLSDRAVYILPKDLQASVLTPLGNKEPTIYMVGGKNSKTNTDKYPLVAIVPSASNDFINASKPRSHDYLSKKADQAEQVKQYIQKCLPELGPFKIHEVATAATMQDWVPGSLGSLYGIAHTTSTVPLLPVTRMQGLFLAGQNILLPGILGGIISAALAIGFATDHASVLEGFRKCAQKELS